MDTLGGRITFLRENRGLTQRELMNELNFNNLSRFERNEMKPGIDIIVLIAEFFDVSTDWLLTGKTNEVAANSHHAQVSPYDIELLAKFHQLGERDQSRIEGMIDGLLMAQSSNVPSERSSSHSTNTDGRDDAATKQAI